MALSDSYDSSGVCVNSEQMVSALAGGALLGVGVARGGLVGGMLALASAPLLARGFAGRIGVKEKIRSKASSIREIACESRNPSYQEGADDIVTEASMESFPASDPPAW